MYITVFYYTSYVHRLISLKREAFQIVTNKVKKSAKGGGGGGVFLLLVDAVAPDHSFTSTPTEATKCSQCIEGAGGGLSLRCA